MALGGPEPVAHATNSGTQVAKLPTPKTATPVQFMFLHANVKDRAKPLRERGDGDGHQQSIRPHAKVLPHPLLSNNNDHTRHQFAWVREVNVTSRGDI